LFVIVPKPTWANNVMQNTPKNVRQYHGQTQQGQTMLYKTLNYIICPCGLWPWYCLTFFDVFCITLFVLVGFGHGIVWRSSMCIVQHCLLLFQNQHGQTMLCKTHLRTSDNTMAKPNKDKQCYTKHIEERQTILWPKPTRRNNVKQNTSKSLVGFGHGIVWLSSMCFV
jgi:hypothetical protein